MKKLWKLSVSISPEGEEAVGELLARIFEQAPSIHTDARTGATVANLFLANARLFNTESAEALKAGFKALRDLGLEPGSGRVRLQALTAENWAESWKKHFPPLDIAGKLLVKPPWSKLVPKFGQAVVVLDPGLSFGTGQHPTTHFCLEELTRRRNPGEPQSFLDLGSGSGILSIAAAKLGYKPVVGVDNDPAAVRISQRNARSNKVQIKYLELDLTRGGSGGWGALGKDRFSMVCANLIYDLLLAEKERITMSVAAEGVLVLAGILQTQFDGVRIAYEGLGWKLARTRGEKEWRSGTFLRLKV